MFNAQAARRSQWLRYLVETVNREIAVDRLELLLRIVWLGASRVLDNTLSVGMLIAFIACKDQFVDLSMLRLHAERVADIALTKPEPRSQPVAFAPDTPHPSIEVQDLCFRYGANEALVLDGVSFRVEPG